MICVLKMITQRLWIISISIFPLFSLAQKDTLNRKQTIDIISSYKPALKNVPKINLSATPMANDSNINKLHYNIPSLNLFYSYQPIILHPLALNIDTSINPGVTQYVKAGYGNLSTPFAETGLSFGSLAKGLVNFYGTFTSSKGKITDQNQSLLNLKATTNYALNKNEIYNSIEFVDNHYNQYGYDHNIHSFSKDSIVQHYTNTSIKAGFKNDQANPENLRYDPSLEISFFHEHNLKEKNIAISFPVEKRFSTNLSANIALKAEFYNYDYTAYGASVGINNSLITIHPMIHYRKDLYTINAGILPIFDRNDRAFILPDFSGIYQIRDNLLIEAGIVGSVSINSFKSLIYNNPFLDVHLTNLPSDPSNVYPRNSHQTEFYAAIRTKIRHHMDVYGKIGFLHISNLPLFINDSISGKGFYIVNESGVNDINIHGELRYYSQDKFTISGILDMNTYSGQSIYKNVWGVIPVTFKSDVRWYASSDLTIKGSIDLISGIPVYSKGNTDKKLPTGIELNIGSEINLSDKFSAWLDLNNLLNSKYQRWNNYPIYGLHILGGLIYRFK